MRHIAVKLRVKIPFAPALFRKKRTCELFLRKRAGARRIRLDSPLTRPYVASLFFRKKASMRAFLRKKRRAGAADLPRHRRPDPTDPKTYHSINDKSRSEQPFSQSDEHASHFASRRCRLASPQNGRCKANPRALARGQNLWFCGDFRFKSENPRKIKDFAQPRHSLSFALFKNRKRFLKIAKLRLWLGYAKSLICGKFPPP